LKLELTSLSILYPNPRTRNSEVLESGGDREKNARTDPWADESADKTRQSDDWIHPKLELVPWNDHTAPGRNEPDRPTEN
jgi:hypothetical protein